MKVEIKDKYKSVVPEEGMMLTDNEVISDGLFVPINYDMSAWREIFIADAEEFQKEIDARNEAEVEMV